MFFYWVADEFKGLTYQEKNKKASEKWRERSNMEKIKFVDSAKVYKELNVKVSKLTEEQKIKLIDSHRKKLLEEVLLVRLCMLTLIELSCLPSKHINNTVIMNYS